eukprot:scaffold17815_cov112-Isochrysis_galbana.AAC.6
MREDVFLPETLAELRRSMDMREECRATRPSRTPEAGAPSAACAATGGACAPSHRRPAPGSRPGAPPPFSRFRSDGALSKCSTCSASSSLSRRLFSSRAL